LDASTYQNTRYHRTLLSRNSTLASPLVVTVFSSLPGDKFNYLKCNLVFIGPSRQVLRQHLKWGN
jgi:hypothetical protein